MRSASPVGKWSLWMAAGCKGGTRAFPTKRPGVKSIDKKSFCLGRAPTRANSEQLRSLLEGKMPVNVKR
jgi:hypothetical protein